jgi:hypothetical protein
MGCTFEVMQHPKWHSIEKNYGYILDNLQMQNMVFFFEYDHGVIAMLN